LNIKAVQHGRTEGSQFGEPDALSALIAHELNNIAVPLRGFIDLAAEKNSTVETFRQAVDEVRISIQRIAQMAFELESLGQAAAAPSAVPISECLVHAGPSDGKLRQSPIFLCDPETPVAVDLHQARRAISSLLHLAGLAPLEVGHSLLAGASCMACGIGLLPSNAFISVEARGLRPAVLLALGSPFAKSGKLRPSERLSVAALQYSVHLTDAHIVAGETDAALSIALPRVAA
jgi:hypothetical protein